MLRDSKLTSSRAGIESGISTESQNVKVTILSKYTSHHSIDDGGGRGIPSSKEALPEPMLNMQS